MRGLRTVLSEGESKAEEKEKPPSKPRSGTFLGLAVKKSEQTCSEGSNPTRRDESACHVRTGNSREEEFRRSFERIQVLVEAPSAQTVDGFLFNTSKQRYTYWSRK